MAITVYQRLLPPKAISLHPRKTPCRGEAEYSSVIRGQGPPLSLKQTRSQNSLDEREIHSVQLSVSVKTQRPDALLIRNSPGSSAHTSRTGPGVGNELPLLLENRSRCR